MQKFLQNPYPPPKPPTWKNHQSHIKNQPKKIIKPPTQKNHQTHDNQRIQANQQPPLSGVRNATTTNLRENPLSSTQVKIINEPNRPKEDQKQTNQSTHTNNKPTTTNQTKPIHKHHRLEFTTPQPPTTDTFFTTPTTKTPKFSHYFLCIKTPYLGFTTPQSLILEKTHYHQSKPKSSTNPTDQRKDRKSVV